jgi:predicted LPLAT superfamily acyltransferase
LEDIGHEQWSGKTGGMKWMQKSLIVLFKLTPLHVVYFLMGCVIPFYMLFAHKGYISMYHFFRQRFGYGPMKSFVHVYLNHYAFGKVILDRFAVYSGRKFQIEIEGYEHFTELASKTEGFVQLSSHVGNYELAGYSLTTDKKKFNALVFSGETETVMKNREKVLSHNKIQMIPVKSDFSHVFIINNALMDGEIVSIPGDRIFGSSKSAECMFFGQKAKFPLGPFAIAVEREVPMISVFVMKETAKRYRIFVKPVALPAGQDMNRRQKMNALAQVFARNLESIIRRYPTQWFNYYEFWN